METSTGRAMYVVVWYVTYKYMYRYTKYVILYSSKLIYALAIVTLCNDEHIIVCATACTHTYINKGEISLLVEDATNVFIVLAHLCCLLNTLTIVSYSEAHGERQ